MRLALLVILSLTLGGLAVATIPAATACTSDPDLICGVIWVLDCAGQHQPGVAVLKECV